MAQTNVELRDGMTCQGCVRSVEMILSKVPGIASARVDLDAGRAAVEYDDSRAKPDQMIDALKQIGFQASKV